MGRGAMAGDLARYADDVDIVLDRLAGGFLRGREQRADIHVKADIGKGGGDDLGAAVVAVLAQFGDQNARATFVEGEGLDLALDAGEAFVPLVLAAVDALTARI